MNTNRFEGDADIKFEMKIPTDVHTISRNTKLDPVAIVTPPHSLHGG